MLKSKVRLLAGAAVFVSATASYGQDTGATQGAPSATEAGTATGIEDIIVTARRRAESLQSVPVAVTAITDEQLRSKSISNPYELVSSTPGIAATTGSAQRNDVIFFIRGQGATFGSTPSVVTYFADVPQQTNAPSGGSNTTFYDLESIQVLKGPQGTLFGRSSTAGAVLLTPKAPGNEFDGFFEAGIGNYSSRDFTGAINIPVIEDKVAIRVAGNYSAHDGYTQSITTGEELDDKNRSSFRVSLRLAPTDWLTNTTIFQDVRIKENGTGTQLWRYYPNRSANGLYNPLLDTTAGAGAGFFAVSGLCNNPALAPFLGSIGQTPAQCITDRVGRINAVKNGLDAEFARLQADPKSRKVATSSPDLYINSHTQQIINTTLVELGEAGFLGDMTFKNTASMFRNVQSTAIREIQGSPVPTGVVFNNLNYIGGRVVDTGRGKSKWGDIWSEEAQLSGSFGGKHDWLVGFFKESTNRNQYLNFPAVFLTLNGAFTIPAGLPGISGNFNRDYKLTQTGYFGQTTIDFADFGLDGLKFTAGYRRSIVKARTTDVATSFQAGGILPTPGGRTIDAALTQKANSYTFALDYEVRPGVLVYATTRKGFKQGGINIQSVVPASLGIPGAIPVFAPEKVTDYELGAKTDWNIGGIAGRTNLALFQAKYKGLHRANSFFNGQTTSNQIANIAGATVRGFEIENTVQFTDAFRAMLSYAYIDAKYTAYPDTRVDAAGNVVPNPLYNSAGVAVPRINTPFTGTPKHKLDVMLQHTTPVDTVGEFSVSANVSYQSKVNLADDSLFGELPESQKGYALANARLDWNGVMDNPIDASFFVRNVFNKFYRVGTGNLVSSALGTTTSIIGDPRTYGVQVRVRFGASADR